MAVTEIKFYWNAGRQGASQAFITKNGPSQVHVARACAEELAILLHKMVYNGPQFVAPTIEAYRIKNLETGESQVFASPAEVLEAHAGEDFKEGDRDNTYTIKMIAGRSHRTVHLYGLPEEWITGILNVKKEPPKNPVFLERLKALNAYLGDQGGVANLKGWCLARLKKTTTFPVSQVEYDNDGYLAVKAAVIDGVVANKTKLRLNGVRGLGARRINGVYRVLGTAIGGGDVTYTLSKRKDDPNPLVLTNRGTVNVAEIEYVEVDRIVPVGPSNKKLGRAFFTTPGRRGAR